jgi:ubiquinone/menaquinone biosynthesis C-methylase UbiE
MRFDALDVLWLDGAPVTAASVEVFRSEGDEIIDGAIWAGAGWYRIEDGILDVLPDPLASTEARLGFARRYGISQAADPHHREVQDVPRKIEQIEFFKEDAERYDRDVSLRSFYVASDRISYGEWVESVEGQNVCDIGAGSGRLTLPMAERGLTVVSTDISEEMIRIGRRRAAKSGLQSRTTFVLADGERLPFRSAIFDAATCYGALHHVPNPGALVAEAGRILREGGRWFSYDPHRSKVRFLFDWAMRIRVLYQELANGNPLISADDAAAWCRRAGLSSDIKFHFFLPPHLLTLVSPDVAEKWLRSSDRLFNGIGLSSFAGVIVVSGIKQAPAWIVQSGRCDATPGSSDHDRC